MRTFVNTIGIILILAVLLTFAMENTHSVRISYYTFADSFQVWGIILIPFCIGVIVGNLLDVVQRFRLKQEIRKLKREVKSVPAEFQDMS